MTQQFIYFYWMVLTFFLIIQFVKYVYNAHKTMNNLMIIYIINLWCLIHWSTPSPILTPNFTVSDYLDPSANVEHALQKKHNLS